MLSFIKGLFKKEKEVKVCRKHYFLQWDDNPCSECGAWYEEDA